MTHIITKDQIRRSLFTDFTKLQALSLEITSCLKIRRKEDNFLYSCLSLTRTLDKSDIRLLGLISCPPWI